MKGRRLFFYFAAAVMCLALCAGARAQTPQTPLTSAELLALVRQLPKSPGLKAEIIQSLRERGINFTLTSGIRAVVATKSGNDAELRRALEEAERRFVNPTAAAEVARPTEAEAADVLSKARAATLEAADAMPDFVVKQIITRANAYGRTQNWRRQDRLVVAVSYRASEGEQYRLLAINGLAVPVGETKVAEKADYSEAGGANSTGEFVSELKALFSEESRAEFKPSHAETLNGRRVLVYEFAVKLQHSRQSVSFRKERTVTVGYRGRVWIDRELHRVLRVESVATDLPADFPITAVKRTIDYGWVVIPGQGEYLLPARAQVEMTALDRAQQYQSRNDIRFRGYQKYGSEVKIIEDDIIEEEPEK
jgi:hypothetical protein